VTTRVFPVKIATGVRPKFASSETTAPHDR
jgi:hypothetical protein